MLVEVAECEELDLDTSSNVCGFRDYLVGLWSERGRGVYNLVCDAVAAFAAPAADH
jgi:hypothetical protein